MYRTPGVYVEEVSTLPPSVVEVSTSIPVFIGYTERGAGLARISTMLDYEERFGGPKRSAYSVGTALGNSGSVTLSQVSRIQPGGAPEFLMYYAVSMYFLNGGGSCYIMSIGDYTANMVVRDDFIKGLARVEAEDEPTLILLTDAVNLPAADYFAVCQAALGQCAKLGDRFAILDLPGDDVQGFRDGIGANDLMYGAAYHPHLRTALSYRYNDADVEVTSHTWSKTFGENGIEVTFTATEGTPPTVKISAGTVGMAPSFSFNPDTRELVIDNTTGVTATVIVNEWTRWKAVNTAGTFHIATHGDGSATLAATAGAEGLQAPTPQSLGAIRATQTALYNQIKLALAGERVILPPSAAVAGVYASVDRTRGIWKAPANVGISSVIGPVAKISDREQEDLNIDPNAGKSINAIRAFTGKGTLVWGARTLAGNDNEWRYVSVRRLFNMIEESSKKASAFAVFEPNDDTTWLKVRGMVESYLYGLWERGALAGPTPEQSYFVNVGLGKTMTTQDVLEGRMIVEIGIAAVRPAEFIVLRFTHKLQEA